MQQLPQLEAHIEQVDMKQVEETFLIGYWVPPSSILRGPIHTELISDRLGTILQGYMEKY